VAVLRRGMGGGGYKGSHNRACVSLPYTSLIRPAHMSKNILSENYWSRCDLYFISFFIACRMSQLIHLIYLELRLLWIHNGSLRSNLISLFTIDSQ
jgi:hypothetical protein